MAPTCLFSWKSLSWQRWACRTPAPVDMPRVLLTQVSVVGCKGRVISEHPKEDYGQNLAKHMTSSRDRCPDPFTGLFRIRVPSTNETQRLPCSFTRHSAGFV